MVLFSLHDTLPEPGNRCQSIIPPPVTTAGVMLLSNPSHNLNRQVAKPALAIDHVPAFTWYDSSALYRPHRCRFCLKPPFHVFGFSQPHSFHSAHLSHWRWNPTVTTPLDRWKPVGSRALLAAAGSGELVRRVSRVVAARRRLICRERVSCKIRARPTLEARPADVWSGRIVQSGKRTVLWSFLQKSNSRHSFTSGRDANMCLLYNAMGARSRDQEGFSAAGILLISWEPAASMAHWTPRQCNACKPNNLKYMHTFVKIVQ